ncbi:MAG TPA: helix-turn-helix transcriptional regulator, partial [Bacillota bacterium]
MTTSPGRTSHHSPADSARPADPARPVPDQDDLQATIRRLREQGGTYRSIAGTAGLAPATIHDLASGRRNPTPATTRALAKVSGSPLRRARTDAGGTRLRLRALHV